jgi:transposase-like protein
MMPKPTTDMTRLPETEVKPDSALEQRTRRKLTPEYKTSILAEADQCQRGELGQLLRRENLYSSQLTQWRRELASDAADGLRKTQPGPKPRKTAQAREIERLQRQNQRLELALSKANACLDLQKKVLQILDLPANGRFV